MSPNTAFSTCEKVFCAKFLIVRFNHKKKFLNVTIIVFQAAFIYKLRREFGKSKNNHRKYFWPSAKMRKDL